MKFSKSTIEKFKKIYLEKEGIELSDEKAFELATNLLLMFDAIYKPIPPKVQIDSVKSVKKKYDNDT